MTITETIQELIHDLISGSDGDADPVGVSVYFAWPEHFAAPAILITTPRNGTYISGGQSFGLELQLSIDVNVLVPRSNAVAELEAINSMVETILHNTADWALTGVDGVALFNVNGGDYPGTIMHLSKMIKI